MSCAIMPSQPAAATEVQPKTAREKRGRLSVDSGISDNDLSDSISSTSSTEIIRGLNRKKLACTRSPPMIGYAGCDDADLPQSELVRCAIKKGVRRFDASGSRSNIKAIGSALQASIDQGIVTRNDLYISCKLCCTEMHESDVVPALTRMIADLRLDFVDNFMIHWPCGVSGSDKKVMWCNDDDQLLATWRSMEQAIHSGLTKTLGVANFNIYLLRTILENGTVLPVLNEIECHPYLPQTDIVDFCQSNGIFTVAHTPLGSDDEVTKVLLEDTELASIAADVEKTPAEVLLRWAVQKGLSPTIRNADVNFLLKSSGILDWQLCFQHMSKLNALNCGVRYVRPEFYDFSAINPGHIRNRAQPEEKAGFIDECGRYWTEFHRAGKELRTKIVIKRGILDELRTSVNVILPEKSLTAKNYVVTDSIVDDIYGDKVLEGVRAAGVMCEKIVINAQCVDDSGESSTEPSKTRKVFNSVCDRILEQGISKHTCIISLGGGVVNNLCGVIASTLYRGISLVHITTTTMGMVDASIDFKQAINHTCGKNLLGAYYPASVIVMDAEVIKTQSKRHILNGISESLKHGICQSLELCDAIRSPLLEAGESESAVHDVDYIETIAKLTMEVKVPTLDGYNDSDFNEMIPQYGHAVAHAVEHLSWSGPNHSPLLHGEAVGIGMCVTAEVARILGICDDECVDLHYSYIGDIGLPTIVPDSMSCEEVLEAMRYDKHFVEMPTMGLCSRMGEMAMSGPHSYMFKVPMDVVERAIDANFSRA